jgi:hypothetical protein
MEEKLGPSNTVDGTNDIPHPKHTLDGRCEQGGYNLPQVPL